MKMKMKTKEDKTTASRVSKRRNEGLKTMATLVVAALGGAATGCADHVQSQIVACPCDQGVCCTSGVCAADEGSCAQATAALSTQAEGQWTGYVENSSFASGSDALKLTFQTQSDGSLAGQVVFGQGTPPAPATDPNVGWPAGYFPPTYGTLEDIGILEGVPFHATNISWTALRLRFQVELAEPWGPWCRLQQSFQVQDLELFTCIPSVSEGLIDPQDQTSCGLEVEPGMPLVRFDCAKVTLCWSGFSACSCSATGCDAGTQLRVDFDIALRGNDADGSIAPGPAQATTSPRSIVGTHNVRLIRASN